MTTTRARAFSVLAAGLSLLTAVSGCDPERQASAEPKIEVAATPVRLAKVRRESAARPLVGVGTVEGKRDTTLSFKVGGVVALVGVDAGAEVKKGQVLARLDQTEVQGSLRQAREALEKAERDEKRARSFHDTGVIPVADLENAKTALEIARAGIAVADFNAAHASITAPDDGVVERRSIEPGEVVGPGVPAFSIRGKAQGWVVRVGLADRDALDLAVGQKSTVAIDAMVGSTFDAVVTQIAERASPRTGTYEVELTIDPKGKRLLSGLVAKVAIERVEKRKLAFVPARALIEGSGRAGAVFVADGDHARRVPVEIAFLSGDEVAVEKGLEGVDEVVGEGAPYLRESGAITVVTQ
jgi:RND family efflux transporter MFP subunit